MSRQLTKACRLEPESSSETRVLGRNKIQDVWSDTPYKVVARPDPTGNVYIVTSLHGENGQRKAIHRRDILDSQQLVPDMAPEAPTETDVPAEVVPEIQRTEDDDDSPTIVHVKLTAEPHVADSTPEAVTDDDPTKDDTDVDNGNEHEPVVLDPGTGDGDAAEVNNDDLPTFEKAGEHPDVDMEPDPPLRRSARLQGKPPPTLTEEVLADMSKSHLLLLTLLSSRN